MSKHTKGPWTINEEGNVATVADDKLIAGTYNYPGENNNHLIAAAPELLEACKLALGTITTADYDIAKFLKNVIAKAEGES